MSKITDRQREIIKFIRTKPDNTAKLIEIVEKFQHWYYCNGRKYVSEIMFRMVKSGKMIKPKRGHYQINDKSVTLYNNNEIIDENQLNMFK